MDEPPRTRIGRLVPVDAASEPVELGEARVVLGRTTTGALADMSVSRQHAAIAWDAAMRRFVIEDAKSRKGSWVDGIPLSDTPYPLDDGTVIRLGDVVFVAELDPLPPEVVGIDTEAVPGRSTAICRLRGELATAARDPNPVMLLGEPGTGKETIARELHRASGRTGPFHVIACGGMSDVDRVQIAAGGTVLLDELAQLPGWLQPEVLRVIQDSGVDVRVIAATSREVADDFNADLRARLAYWEIWVPPLRERRADVMMWFHRLLGASSLPYPVDAEVVEALVRAPWPDNLRGLHRIVKALASKEAVDLAGVQALLRSAPAPSLMTRVRRPTPTADELFTTLVDHGNSVAAVAKYYGRDRKQIFRWMKDFGID